MTEQKPLFVDLDGTLIDKDLSNLAFWDSLKKRPILTLIYLFLFIFYGKSFLKEKISKDYKIPFDQIKFNKSCLDFIRNIKNHHRVVYLISGSHQNLVDQMNEKLKIFFEVFGTKRGFNMVGYNKVLYITNELKFRILIILEIAKKIYLFGIYTKNIIYTNANKNLLKIIITSSLPKTHIESNFIFI
jgi:hypothetical protein